MQVNSSGNKISKSESDSLHTSSNNEWKYEDEFYKIYYLQHHKIALTNTRPSKADTAIKLCIPAAFTQLDDGSIDGLFIVNGKAIDSKKVNHHLGGGFLIEADKIQMLGTNDGKILTNTWQDSVCKLNVSFFQQIQMVRNGEALVFNKDQKLFQRRAIVIYADGNVAMIETKSPITLSEFANDLVRMKVWNAMYTDMGSYDEGWVRDPGNEKIIVIGNNRMETARQSNWLIFKN